MRAPRAFYEPLNERCWFRAIHDDELDLALADCSAALKLKPDFAAALDSRGFVELRMNRLDAAIADYSAALAAAPNMAESLYGRGLAEAPQRPGRPRRGPTSPPPRP